MKKKFIRGCVVLAILCLMLLISLLFVSVDNGMTGQIAILASVLFTIAIFVSIGIIGDYV